MLDIRFSEIQRFKNCRRSWYNGYVLGLTKPEDPAEVFGGPREIGTVVDRALRHYYFSGTPLLDTWQRLYNEAPRLPDGTLSKSWVDVLDTSERMLEGYEEWLEEEGEDAGERTVGTEIELTVPLCPEANLVVHIDHVLIDAFGELVLSDNKTVGTFEKGATFAIDDQLLTYVWAWEQAGLPPIRRVRHNMLRRVKRTGNAKPPFFKRESFNVNDEQVAAQGRKIQGAVKDLLEVRAGLVLHPEEHQALAYPRPSRDCSWICEFEPICVAHDDGSDLDGLRSELYISTRSTTP